MLCWVRGNTLALKLTITNTGMNYWAVKGLKGLGHLFDGNTGHEGKDIGLKIGYQDFL
jgi:hypothetical protein